MATRGMLGAIMVMALAQSHVAVASALSRSSDRSGLSSADATLGLDSDPDSGGPVTLEAYCEGGPAPLQEEQRVLANWKGFGTFYPGRIESANDDDTFDVLYDDSWTETGVSKKLLKPEKASEPAQTKPTDDAICELSEDVKDVRAQIEDAQRDVGLWLAGQRAKVREEEVDSYMPESTVSPSPSQPGAPASVLPASPAAAPGISQRESERSPTLAGLKSELARLDEEIEEVSQDVDSNRLKIERRQVDDVETAGPKTVDDLIAEYQQKIAKRKALLRSLKEMRKKQEQQLASMGAYHISIGQISEKVKKVSADIDALRRKRDKLESEARLDAELRSAIDDLLNSGAKLRGQVDALMVVKEKVDAAREAAEAEKANAAREAAEAGKAVDPAEGPSPKLGTTNTVTHARPQGSSAAETTPQADDAEDELLAAAANVDKELQSMSHGAMQLETGVHPSGHKWWRYRYEHSYIEAVLMVFISFLMMFSSTLMQWGRAEVYRQSAGRSNEILTHGSLMVHWFELFTCELSACLLVYLVVWVLDQFNAFDLLPKYDKGSATMHLPTRADEVRRVALQLITLLFVSLVLNFVLMLSIVRATHNRIEKWAQMDAQSLRNSNAAEEACKSTSTRGSTRTLTVMADQADFWRHKTTFAMELDRSATGSNCEVTTGEWQADQFFGYLRMSVRDVVDDMLKFGADMWFAILVTFVILSVLHRFAHIGYMRVMVFFLAMLMGSFAMMTYFVYRVNHEDADSSGQPHDATLSSARLVVSRLMRYTMFFLCYGFARMTCQPWMWKLFFWQVLGLTGVTLLLAMIFATFIAPMVPNFGAAVSLPPYLNGDKLREVADIAGTSNVMSSTEYLALSARKNRHGQ